MASGSKEGPTHRVDPGSVGLTRDYTELGDLGVRGRVDELSALLENPFLFDPRADHEPGRITEIDQRDPEGVTRPDEPGRFLRGIGEDRPRDVVRLVGDDTYRSAVDAAEPGDDLGREAGLEFEQRLAVDEPIEDVVDVIGSVRLVGDHRVEAP